MTNRPTKTPPQDLIQTGRIALRVEGDFWNAYYAPPDTMAGAILLGSISIGIVQRSETTKRAFMDLMRAVVADMIRDTLHTEPAWSDPISAPEHERNPDIKPN